MRPILVVMGQVVSLKNSYVEVLTPHPKIHLIWKSGLYRSNQVRMSHLDEILSSITGATQRKNVDTNMYVYRENSM